jgi:polyhydroxyalkanoate synthesis regulator phasin
MKRGGFELSNVEGVETPDRLGELYLDELDELVGQGEISTDFARRVTDDLFEPPEPGQARKLRPSVWRLYVAQLTGDFS